MREDHSLAQTVVYVSSSYTKLFWRTSCFFQKGQSSEIANSVKSARKAKGKLHKACERASETHEQTLHGQEQNGMRMASMRESRDSDRFLVNTQVQSHALLR